jgi:hypothetical protein
LIINDLSLNEISENKFLAMQKMEIFLDSYICAIQSGVSREVIIASDLNVLQLSEDYHIYNWRNDIKHDPEKRHLYHVFNNMINRSQLLHHIDDLDKEFVLDDGNRSKVLLKCFVDQHIAFSFTSNRFTTPQICGSYNHLDHELNMVEEEAIVFNLALSEHVRSNLEIQTFIEEVNKQYSLNFNNNEQFWDKREVAFPSLVFCENVRKQVANLEKTALVENVKKIIRLEQYFSQWNWGAFDYRDIPCTSPESSETLKAYERQHTFTTPFGENVIVSFHIKGAAFDNRVYFHLDYIHKKVVICSVGEHLPCITYG